MQEGFLGAMGTKGVQGTAPLPAAAVKGRAEDTHRSEVHSLQEGRRE